MEKNLRRFVDKHVIITGGGSGIGAGIAQRFADEGAQVTVADVNTQGGEAIVAGITKAGGKAVYLPVDVASEASIKQLIDKAAGIFGPIHIGVSNAGISGAGLTTALDISELEWDKIFAVNTRGAFMFCRACANNMMEHDIKGALVTTSSIMGRSVKSQTAAYCASKAAVIMFTKSLAKTLAPAGIRVNSIAPGLVRTHLYDNIESEMSMEKDSFVPWIIEQSINTGQLLIPREGTPEDMAAAVAFLASDDASYITAQVLCVDGGTDWCW